MREIKFRAWTFDRHARLLPKEEWDEARTACYEGKWSMCEVLTYHIRKNKVRVYTGRGFDKCLDIGIGDNCILMQNTGILDVNEEEIYESDLVCILKPVTDWQINTLKPSAREKYIIHELKSGKYAQRVAEAIEIKWSEKDYRFVLGELRKNSTEHGHFGMDGGRPSLRGKKYLRVGNIYENPELLEKAG